MWDQFAFQTATYFEHLNRTLVAWANEHVLNIIIILLASYLIRFFGIKFLSGMTRHTVRHDLFPSPAERNKRIQTLDSLISATVRVGTWIIAIVMIIGELGVNTGPLLASASFLGIAFGFGAQSLVKDFVTGIFIISENQYRLGDVVAIGSVSGTVEAITIRTTILRDLDGNVHHVPNGTIAVTTNKTSRFSLMNEDLTVPLDTNIDELKHVINHVGEELASKADFKHLILEAPHYVRIDGFDNTGLRIKIFGTVTESEKPEVVGEFYHLLLKAFAKHNITVISNQQVTVHSSDKKK